MDALRVRRPTHEPRAHTFVQPVMDLALALIESGHAYESGGSVFVHGLPVVTAGEVDEATAEQLLRDANGRLDDPAKRHPFDQAVWQASTGDEPAWPSPWGPGRPGWHAECTAMALSTYGPSLDLHAGGADLRFPHHAFETAQAEAATGVTPFARAWMHVGTVCIDGEKMAKSLGNFFTIREVLAKYDAEVLRFFILRAHYRSPVNYTDANLEDAKAALTRLYTALRDAVPAKAGTQSVDWNEPHAKRFKEAMDDDFGTPEAIAELFQLANKVFQGDSNAAKQLKALGAVLGLLQRDPNDFLRAAPTGVDEQWIEERIAARQAARKSKNFAEGDRIRNELLEQGIVLEDKGAATTWRRK